MCVRLVLAGRALQGRACLCVRADNGGSAHLRNSLRAVFSSGLVLAGCTRVWPTRTTGGGGVPLSRDTIRGARAAAETTLAIAPPPSGCADCTCSSGWACGNGASEKPVFLPQASGDSGGRSSLLVGSAPRSDEVCPKALRALMMDSAKFLP